MISRWPFIAVLVLACSGCATYADRATAIRQAFYANDLARAQKTVDEELKRGGGEADVLTLERAMIDLAAGRPAEAEQKLRKVRDHFDELEGVDLTGSTLSYLTDDQRRAYAGEDYEKVLIRAFLALSNLMHDGGDAEAYSLQMIDKQERIITAGADREGKNPKLSYQRVALAPYLRGVLREATHRDFDDAQRSFASVVSWQPSFLPGPQDLQRASYGRHSEPGNGVLYVFALTGRGPFKQESIEVPTTAALLIAGEILSVAGSQTVPPNVAPVKVPRVFAQNSLVESITVINDGETLGKTAVITDVSDLAVSQYEAVLPSIVARAVARRIVKKGFVYGAKEAADMAKGTPAGLALDLAGVAWEATESADTRCWGLLPDKIQVLRVELPQGEHDIQLAPVVAGKSRSSVKTRVSIENGRNTYLLANFPNERLVGQVISSTR